MIARGSVEIYYKEGAEGTFRDEGNSPYLDYGGGYRGVHLSGLTKLYT